MLFARSGEAKEKQDELPGRHRGSIRFLKDLELNSPKSIQLNFKGRKVQKLPRRAKTTLPKKNLNKILISQKINILLTLILSIVIIAGSIYQAELVYSDSYQQIPDEDNIKFILCGLACLQILLVLQYYFNALKIKKAYKTISKYSLIYHDTETFISMLLEIMICSIVAPPYIHYTYHFFQLSTLETLDFDDIILPFVFLRLYYILKTYYVFTYFNSIKSKFYCDLELVTNK